VRGTFEGGTGGTKKGARQAENVFKSEPRPSRSQGRKEGRGFLQQSPGANLLFGGYGINGIARNEFLFETLLNGGKKPAQPVSHGSEVKGGFRGNFPRYPSMTHGKPKRVDPVKRREFFSCANIGRRSNKTLSTLSEPFDTNPHSRPISKGRGNCGLVLQLSA